ncbi:MAG TPA: response regulator [Terriglobia bacterium]|nr:response regulator [Terriglobia bacterium]
MAKKATILIVDKEKILVDLLIRALSSPELLMIGTTSADEGARLVDLYGPDLSVIDASVQNGLPLVSSLSSGPFKTKIVAVVDSREIRERVEALHVETIVDRSSGLEALVGAIRAALPADLRILGQTERAGILICDDEDEIRTVVAEYLKGRGYAIWLAKHGREALDLVEKNPSIQIVLLDLSMPMMGGMEVLKHLMKHEPHPSVIMMTAIADREIARQAMKIGAFDYILKPFDFAAIQSSIETCLSYSEYQKQPWWKRLTRR